MYIEDKKQSKEISKTNEKWYPTLPKQHRVELHTNVN
jgi:hypothetical protein